MYISKLSDSELSALRDRLDGHDCSYEDDCPDCKILVRIEREQDARDLWNSDDARVRESVGNYGS